MQNNYFTALKPNSIGPIWVKCIYSPRSYRRRLKQSSISGFAPIQSYKLLCMSTYDPKYGQLAYCVNMAMKQAHCDPRSYLRCPKQFYVFFFRNIRCLLIMLSPSVHQSWRQNLYASHTSVHFRFKLGLIDCISNQNYFLLMFSIYN